MLYNLEVWGYRRDLKKYCHLRTECTNVPYAVCKHTKDIIENDLPPKHYSKIVKNL